MPDAVIQSLFQAGLQPARVLVDGRPIELSWAPNAADPVLDSRILVVLPDLHLGDGGQADIFLGSAGQHHRSRLEQFLLGLIAAKAGLAQSGRRLSLLQLGDCYDVWRAFPFHEQIPGRTYEAIRVAYPTVISRMIDDLDCRFCVGNHDAMLAKYPPDWAFAVGARLAYAQRFCQGRVFAFHGHQGDDIVDEVAGQNGQIWVALGSAFTSVLNPAGMALQEYIDKREDAYPGDQGGWPEGQPPPAGSPWTAPRWSNYSGKPARFQRIFESMQANSPAIASAVRLAIVGHSHRPGLAWFRLANRTIPVLDVGSWTYGQSQFAVLSEGKATVWEL